MQAQIKTNIQAIPLPSTTDLLMLAKIVLNSWNLISAQSI